MLSPELLTRGALLVLCATAVAACSTPGPGPRIPSATAPSAVAPRGTATPAASPSTLVLGPATGDLSRVDWTQVAIPGEFCGIPGLVAPSAETAASDTWGPVGIWRDPAEVVYGDLDGDGGAEAALKVGCNNQGGTAGGQLAFAYIVVANAGADLVAVGSVTPQWNPPGQHVTLLNGIEMAGGRAVVQETWYRDADYTCCPTGKSVTVWTLTDGRLVPGSPNVVS